MIQIEPMTDSNAVDVLRLGSVMHRTSTFADMRYSGEELAEFLQAMLDLPHLQGFLAVQGLRTVGFILCGVNKSFFGPDLVASEFALYVDPESRGAGVAKQLVQSYVDWAIAKGARRVNAGNSAGTPDEAYVSLMEGVGFTKTGSQLYKTV